MTSARGQNLQPIFEQEVDEGPKDEQEAIEHPKLRQTIQQDHPIDNVLRSLRKGVTTYSHLANFCQYYSFVSSLEPLKVEQALGDPDSVMAMQEELNNFKCFVDLSLCLCLFCIFVMIAMILLGVPTISFSL